ncbi:hypothetical protein H0H93_002320 [Arthromyces matolae]|nr:hypothetical protein H0H93_002320 [Arthromyces matolae]
MSTYLITGASRGIGLELAKILTSLPSTEVSLVFATTRQSQPTTLQELAKSTLGRVVPVQMDPNDPASVKAAVEQVGRVVKDKGGKGLDVLINNSGVMDYTGGPAEKMKNLTETFNTNVTLAHIATQAFMPLLRQGQRKTVANV